MVATVALAFFLSGATSLNADSHFPTTSLLAKLQIHERGKPMKTTLKIFAALALALFLSGSTSLRADNPFPLCPPLCPPASK